MPQPVGFRAAVPLAALLTFPCVLAAQSVAAGDSALARGDTTAAIRAYETATKHKLDDAEAHYRAGLLYLARQHRENSVDDNRLKAEEHLKFATRFQPDSERYLIALVAAYRSAPEMSLRMQIPNLMGRVGELASRHPSPANAMMLYRAARVEMGRRRPPSKPIMPQTMQELMPSGTTYDDMDVVDRFLNRLVEMDLEVGGTSIHKAEEYLRAAIAGDPKFVKAAELLALIQTDQRRFPEAIETARHATQAAADSGRAWAALGMAQARSNKWDDAQATFGKALKLMSIKELRPYEDIGTLMAPPDSQKYERMNVADRARLRFQYWAAWQPLFLTNRNELRTEFYARVTEQEIRLADRDVGPFDIRDTPFTAIRLRYGPQQMFMVLGDRYWIYPHSRLHDLWTKLGGDVGPEVGRPAINLYGEARNGLPVAFDNVPAHYNMDTIDVQTALFRGDTPDTTDMALFTFSPAGRMSKTAPRIQLQLMTAAFVKDDLMRDLAHRQDTAVIAGGDTLLIERRRERFSVTPGQRLMRVEAYMPAIERAARSQTLLNVRSFAGDSLMMSDVIMAGNLVPRDSTPQHWTDFIIEGSSGRLAPKQTVGLLWEIYNLVPDTAGVVRYRVELRVTVMNIERHGILQIIPGTIGDWLGLSSKGDDAAALGYNRAAAAPRGGRRVEYLTLNLADAPNAEYEIEVQVTDQIQNKAVSGLRRLVITPTPLMR